MPTNFFFLPPELRISVYRYVIGMDAPPLPTYAGLRGSCRQIRQEFDPELLPHMKTQQAAEVVPIVGKHVRILRPNRATFNATRLLYLTILASWARYRYAFYDAPRPGHLGGQDVHGPLFRLLNALSQHVQCLRIEILDDDIKKSHEWPLRQMSQDIDRAVSQRRKAIYQEGKLGMCVLDVQLRWPASLDVKLDTKSRRACCTAFGLLYASGMLRSESSQDVLLRGINWKVECLKDKKLYKVVRQNIECGNWNIERENWLSERV
jgi:hypothetical protein